MVLQSLQNYQGVRVLTSCYAKEWLNTMTCEGYLEYDAPVSVLYFLQSIHPMLTEEGGPMFVSGVYQRLLADVRIWNESSGQ